MAHHRRGAVLVKNVCSTIIDEPSQAKRDILRCLSCGSHEGPLISFHEVKRTLPHFKDRLLTM